MTMTSKQFSILRELLTAGSAALVTYGIGSDAIWQEATGGIIAAVMLAWGIKVNTGKEQWLTLARKTMSAVGGVLVMTGTIAPNKLDMLLGVGLSALSLVWTMFKLPEPPEQPGHNEAGPPA
jgi:hypothetical protein